MGLLHGGLVSAGQIQGTVPLVWPLCQALGTAMLQLCVSAGR